MQKSKVKITIQSSKLAKPKKALFLAISLVLVFGLFSAFQAKSQQPLPKKITEEMEKREIFNCEPIPYGELLHDTEKHLDKFLPLLIDLKDKAKAVFPEGLKIIDLAGDCRCEYCKGVCECEKKSCVKVEATKELDDPIDCVVANYHEKEYKLDVKCIEGRTVKVKKVLWGACIGIGQDVISEISIQGVPPIIFWPFMKFPRGEYKKEVPQCGKCCCESNNYVKVDSWTTSDGMDVTLYNVDCAAPTPPPSSCECQSGQGPDVCDPGEYCDGCNCQAGPPPPEITPTGPGGGGGGTPSLCKPKPCSGNPCIAKQFGTNLIGKDKEKEEFKEALKKIRLLERELDQLHNAAYRLEDAFGFWYRNRQKQSLFDCYTLKDMNLPEGPSDCPFNGNNYFYCY